MATIPNLTEDEFMAAIQSQMHDLENPGYCTKCGAYHDDCEPDMRRRKCEDCGALAVYGAEELLVMGYYQ